MLDLKELGLVASRGHRLTTEAYRRDFREYRGEVCGRPSWKLERQQQFEEQDISWLAFSQGRWEESLRLLDEERAQLLAVARQDRERSTAFHRVRVVEEPMTAYVQWELHALKVQAESGKRIRIICPGDVATLEAADPLPEVVVLGDRVLYRVVYTAAGALDGAVRFSDPELIRGWGDFIEGLYESGEDVLPYFARCVAHLPPPQARVESASNR